MHGSVGGSSERLVSSLEGEGTQCKPLNVDLKYHKQRTQEERCAVAVPLGSHDVLERAIYIGALVLGLVQLRGFPTNSHREP